MKIIDINLNDSIRTFLLDFYDKKFLQGLEHKKIIEEFGELCYENTCFNLDNNKYSRDYILTVLYCDALKYVLYKHKVALVNDETALLLCDLKRIDDTNELVAELSANIDLLYKIVDYAYKYAELNCLSKKIICKSLSYIETKWINKYFSSNVYDSFSASSKIEIQDIVEELKNDNIYQNKSFDMDLTESNIFRIMGVINSLEIYDKDNYYDLLLEIAKVDYSVCKFMSKCVDDFDYAFEHIDLYENYGLEDILEVMSTNQVFLKSCLWMVYSLYIDKEYDDVELPYEEVNKEISPQMIKKFSFKDDKK